MQRTLFFALAFVAVSGVAGIADPSFPTYGNVAIMPDSFPGIVGVNTNIDVLVFNTGDAASGSFDVELSFNDWGVTYQGWQPIGTQTYGVTPIAANDNEQQTFSHTFANRAHTCLQALIVDASPNELTTNDRTQINWEVVHADDDYNMWVPFGNAADEEIVIEGTTITCFKDDAEVPCGARGDNPDEGGIEQPKIDGVPDGLLENEEALAMVKMPEIPEEGMVVLVRAKMGPKGKDLQLNHVMINVVKTTVVELLNTPHLCCIESIKTRVLLESILAEALDKYEADPSDCKGAIKLLRMFVQKAILLECDLSDEEIACIEKAILKIVDAGIMIAQKHATTDAKMKYLMEAHFFRRAGLYEAALLEASKAC